MNEQQLMFTKPFKYNFQKVKNMVLVQVKNEHVEKINEMKSWFFEKDKVGKKYK